MEEGYIKFNCILRKGSPPDKEITEKLNIWRDRLYSAGLIGMFENGIGYGNISLRLAARIFVITGSRTGGIAVLKPEHYTTVTDYDINNNLLVCEGLIKASSESLTHAAAYDALPEINSVVHIHSEELWSRYLHVFPATSDKVEYGTPEMAAEIQRLLKYEKTDVKVMVMAGHRPGLLSYGKSLKEAAEEILNIINY